jgi:O-antigen/teichoic acid export membrane protein
VASFRSALKFSYLGGYAVIVFQLLTSLVVARLLEPSDFGLYSVAMVFAVIAELIRNFGVSNYIIKEKELTTQKLECALFLLIVTSSFVAGLQFFMAVPIGNFYNEERLTAVLQLLSLNLVLIPFGAITKSRLRRELRMKELSIIDVTSNLVGSLVTLSLAYMGWGVFSLPLGLIAVSLTSVLITFFFRYDDNPKRLRVRGSKDIFSFSSIVGLTGIVNHIGNSSQDWLLGKLVGMESVGLYSRGSSTVALFDRLVSNPVNLLIAPVFATKANSGEAIVPTYIKLTCIQASIAWPCLITLAYFSEPIINLLYGAQWLLVSDLLVWICLAKILMTITQYANEILVGVGKASEVFYANLLMMIVKIAILIACIDLDLVYIVMAVTLSVQTIRLFTYLFILNRSLKLDVTLLAKKLARVAFVCGLSVSPLLLYDRNEVTLTLVFLPFISLMIWFFFSKVMKLDVYLEIDKVIERMYLRENFRKYFSR